MPPRIVIEPLARYDPKGELVPEIAAEIPTLANGGISKDLKSITWKLKPGITWSDGSPVTADDVVFTGQYCMDPNGGCAQLSHFQGVDKIEAVDAHDGQDPVQGADAVPLRPVRRRMNRRSCRRSSSPNCMGAKAPTCTDGQLRPDRHRPVRRHLVQAERRDPATRPTPNYRDPNKPAFATVNFKGGGDAAAAARAVFQTGEYDYAWNIQLSPDVLKSMTGPDSKGKVVVAFGTLVERLEMNHDRPLAEPARRRARDRQAPEPDPDGHACARGAVDGDRPQPAGPGRLWPGRQAHLQPGARPGGLCLRQHRLPEAGHPRRQEASRRSRLEARPGRHPGTRTARSWC